MELTLKGSPSKSKMNRCSNTLGAAPRWRQQVSQASVHRSQRSQVPQNLPVMEKRRKQSASDVPNGFKSRGFVFVGVLSGWMPSLFGAQAHLKELPKSKHMFHNVPGTLVRTSQIRRVAEYTTPAHFSYVPAQWLTLFHGNVPLFLPLFSWEKWGKHSEKSYKHTCVAYHCLTSFKLRSTQRASWHLSQLLQLRSFRSPQVEPLRRYHGTFR